jgi:hypothetical protein
VIETTRIQAEGQIKAAERNAQYLKTFLDFISIPQKLIYTTFQNFVNGAFVLLRKLGVEVEDIDIITPFEKLKDFAVKQIFDPEQEKKDGEKVVKDAQKSLTSLTNQRDGILNAQDAKEKSERDKANADRLSQEQKTNAAILESRKKLAEQSLELTKKIREDAAKPVESTKTEVKNFDEEIKAQRDAEERRISFMAEGVDKEIALADLKAIRLRDAAQGNADELKAITAQNAADVDAIRQRAAEKELADAQAVQDAKIALTTQALSSVSQLIGAFAKQDEASQKRAFRAQKAISVAQATIDTYASANAAFLSTQKNPVSIAFPAAPYIAAGAAVAAGIANVATIAKQQFTGGTPPGGGNETPPTLTGGGGGDESQPAQFNPLASQFIQNQPEQITPRAFVLAGDVSSQQEVREKVQDLARLG